MSHQPAGRNKLLAPRRLLLLAIPAAAALKFGGAADLWVFAGSGVAIIPLAALLSEATGSLAGRLGPTVGALLNATFGNAAELIIALMILARGPELYPVVKATITGSILCNLLVVLGLSAVVGGVRYPKQTFSRRHAGVGATLLAIACAGLILPTLFYYLFREYGRTSPDDAHTIEDLSEEISVVLMVIYALSLVYTLAAPRQPAPEGEVHRPPGASGPPTEATGAHWGLGTSLGVMVAATGAVAVLGEWFAGAVEPAAVRVGLNKVFVGVVLVAVVGSAAEYITAMSMAWHNRMNVSFEIALGSSTQVALFIGPVLVFASMLMGHPTPLDLHFGLLEVAALLLSVGVVAMVSHDGETHWLEGAMLLALYAIFALAFYHVPNVK